MMAYTDRFDRWPEYERVIALYNLAKIEEEQQRKKRLEDEYEKELEEYSKLPWYRKIGASKPWRWWESPYAITARIPINYAEPTIEGYLSWLNKKKEQ